MSDTRKAVAISITIESNGDDSPLTVRITGPGEQWSAALRPANVPDTVAEMVGRLVHDVMEVFE